MADLRRLAQRAVAKLYHDSFIHGRLGRLNSDGSYTVRVPDRPTHAYVQMASEGGQTIATARNPGNVRLAANLPVRMRSESGELIIDGLDYDKLAMVESADPDGPPAHGIPTHHHRIGSGLEYEYDPRLFEAGRVYHAGSMSVYINPFRYQKPDGTFEYWEGGALNISSHQPGTSGEHAWVLIGVDPTDNTATAAAGTAKADTSELTVAELDDIAFAGKIPCGAVRMREDDTDLSDLTKYVDAHGWFNQTLNQLRSLTGNLGVFVADNGAVGIGGPASDVGAAAKFGSLGPNGLSDADGDADSWFPFSDGNIYITPDADGSGDGDVIFRVWSDAAGMVELARLKGTGNFGIGTPSPGQPLDVNGIARLRQRLQVVGDTAPVDGDGVEIGSTASRSVISSFDRTGSHYKDMHYNSLSHGFYVSGSRQILIESGRVQIEDASLGVGPTSPSAKIHADQSSTTGAIPVLVLDQADLSEEMIRFDTTVGTGNPVDTGAIGTLVAKVRVSVNGTFRYIPLYDS